MPTYKEMKQVLSLVSPLLPQIILTILLGVCGYLSITLISVLGGASVLHLSGVVTYGSLKLLLVSVLLAGILRAVFRLAEQYCTHYIAFRLLAVIRSNLFKKFRSFSAFQLKKIQKGEVMSIVTKDVELLEVFYAHTIAPVCIGIITTILYVLALGYFHPLYALLGFTSYVTIAIIVPVALYHKGNKVAADYRQTFGEMSSYLIDRLKGLKELLIFQREDDTIQHIHQKGKVLNNEMERLKIHEGHIKGWTDFALYGSLFSQVLMSIYLYNLEVVTIEQVLLALLLLISSFGPALALSYLSASLVQTFASMKRVVSLFQLESTSIDTGIHIVNEIEEIQFKNVSFGYERNSLFSSIQMKLQKGEIVGLKGPNGAGKSTLISLLLKELQPKKGSITINGSPVTNFTNASIYEQISMMDAQTILFTDTLRNNITLYGTYSEEEIKDACKKAALTDWINELEKGLDTPLEEDGTNISSGQKQRIALARLFLKNSTVWILDEPTTNIDRSNEKVILSSIKNYGKDKIIFMISHSEELLLLADRVYELDKQLKEV